MEQRLEKRLEWAQSRDRKARAGFDRAHGIADMIPVGQPVLVGHHSEGRHRRDLKRIDSGMRQGVQSMDMAAHHRGKADGIATQLERSIFSDDVDAVERLQERIAGLEQERARMKAINKEIRKGKGWQARLEAEGITLTEREGKQLVDVAKFQPYYCKEGLPVFPPYALQNLGGNINRLKKRLKELDNE